MGRDDDIAAILETGRQTRRRAPRGLWITAIIVGAICTAGFVMLMLAPRDSVTHVPERRAVDWHGAGLGLGLVIGGAVGIAIGVAIGMSIGRQRSHSSRNSP